MPCLTPQRAARLIAKSRFIGQYPPQNREKHGRFGAGDGNARDRQILDVDGCGVCIRHAALCCCSRREASAQFNIEGIIRGAIQQQGCCYGGGGISLSSGSGIRAATSTSHRTTTPTLPLRSDKSKEKDATQLEPPNNNAANSGRQQLSRSGAGPSVGRPDAPTRQTSAPPGNDDQPAFSPSR